MHDANLLRSIPKVDDLLRSDGILAGSEGIHRTVLTDAARAVTDRLRTEILAGSCTEIPGRKEIAQEVLREAKALSLPSLRRVLNATGVILHTNLGRAVMCREAAQAAYDSACGYSTLEYDLAAGCRGKRYAHVEPLLAQLTGAESALVVNNNAAAVLLLLTALTSGGEVVVSRGELVEIGGSFRIPDVMQSCGAVLREVGATNKTHIDDYERAIGPETRALMKVHTSNYRIVGFSESVPRADMVRLGHERGLPVFEDLGSGCFVDLGRFGLRDEPMVRASVEAGMDVVTFSGDKLLGGPQAGILVGRKKYIDILKKHPLLRALRVDKMTLAALEATLRVYAQEREKEIPVIEMLAAGPDEMLGRAEELARLLSERGVRVEIVPVEDETGGGSVPMQTLPSRAVAIRAEKRPDDLEKALRKGDPAVICRIEKDMCLLHVRTLRQEELAEAADAVEAALR